MSNYPFKKDYTRTELANGGWYDSRFSDKNWIPYPGQEGRDTVLSQDFLRSPREGEACDCPPAKLTRLARTDAGPRAFANRWIAEMSIDFQIQGEYQELQIRWWTCERKDTTAGIIPGCNDSNNCRFVLGYGTYLAQAHVRFLSCDDGKLTTHVYRIGGSYVNQKSWPTQDFKVDPAPGTSNFVTVRPRA